MSEAEATASPARDRFERLRGYLAHDPGNVALLLDAAEAAIDAGRPDDAGPLIARAAAIAPDDGRGRGLAGLAAMHTKDFGRAADIYAALLAAGADDAAVRFNLAWARAMEGDEAGALAALDDTTGETLPRAAALEVQLRHTLGELETAYERGKRYLALYPENRALNAAMAVLAIDMADEELAARCAAMAPGHPDALTTLGTLALDGDAAAAEALFDRALDADAEVPRAWVGRGLARLVTGQADRAPADIDRGAAMFGDHLGSWIAAGWAWFVAGDLAAARERFDRALAIDATFAETHGSLAVLDILAGDVDAGRGNAAVALRLDRQCYSAALAQALLSAGAGDAETSRRIVERALHTPIDDGGRTIGQALARMQTVQGGA